MFPLVQIGVAILRSVPTIALNPIFWTFIVLVMFQYSRVAAMQARMLGQVVDSPGSQTLESVLYGFAGGVLGSLVFVVIGVSLFALEGGSFTDRVGLGYVFLVAIALMVIHPHLLCFSYAGGIVALSSLIFGFPKVGIPELMSLVAVLHMVESVLIRASGHLGAVPVFLKDRLGKPMGGFLLQRFWPVPVTAMLIATVKAGEITGGMISMPDWWPLIKPGFAAPPGRDLLYAMFAVPAVLGYGDLALARSPKARTTSTSIQLFIYSAVLLVLAVMSGRYSFLKPVAVVFAPLGHEAVIRLGRRMEFGRPPIYVAPDKGVMVLATVPGSPGSRAGLESGDIILSINDHRINSRSDMAGVLQRGYGWLVLEVLKRRPGRGRAGGEETVSYRIGGEVESLGIVLVPEAGEPGCIDLRRHGLLGHLWGRYRRR